MGSTADGASGSSPYETQVHLFHDQTEDRDGQPGVQREGWPAPKDREVKPRYEVVQEQAADNPKTQSRKKRETKKKTTASGQRKG